PLIDIMFFLLASFMMVSLAMIKIQSLRMNLPTAAVYQSKDKPTIINLEIDRVGDVFVVGDAPADRRRLNLVELGGYLSNRVATATNSVPVYIKGSPEATHGQVLNVVDTVKLAGIEQVSFNISPVPGQK
ncbi:MAG TPA: biopolymer transporter ExbD, partial [Verrucomicrobiota bacterium]|nr:biopolymer transporter ExbD [Verrucomicrobiota bacterium]